MWLRICRAQSQENPAEQDPAKLCLPFIGDLPSPAAAAGYDVATCRNAMQQADDAAGQLKTAYGLLPLRRQVWSRDINTRMTVRAHMSSLQVRSAIRLSLQATCLTRCSSG